MFHSARPQKILKICTGGWSEFTKSKYSMQDNNGKRDTVNAFRVEKQKWHRGARRVPFGAQKNRDTALLPHLSSAVM